MGLFAAMHLDCCWSQFSGEVRTELKWEDSEKWGWTSIVERLFPFEPIVACPCKSDPSHDLGHNVSTCDDKTARVQKLQYALVINVTGPSSVGELYKYTLHGEWNDPRKCQGRGIIAVLHLSGQTVREEMAIVDLRVCGVFFRSIAAPVSPCMSASRHSESTPDLRRVSLCVHDDRAFRTVQAVLQTAAAVVSSHNLGSGGNGGNSML